MFSILGYTSDISVAAGETLRCHVSAERDQRYTARIVRVINGDCIPQGPGFQVEHVPTAIDGEYAGRRQRTDAGSYMIVPRLAGVGDRLAFVATIWPTLLAWPAPQVIAQYASEDGCFTLGIDAGAIVLTATHGAQRQVVALPVGVLVERDWVRVACVIDPVAGSMCLEATPQRGFPTSRAPTRSAAALTVGLRWTSGGVFSLAGAVQPNGTVDWHFNGKIEAPALLCDAAVPEGASLRPLPPSLTPRVVAAWDFAHEMTGTRAIDVGPLGQHGTLVNLPARAMTGASWTSDVHRWRDKPEAYGAIHFHHDDLYDAGWEVAFSLTVPDSLRSGAYAVHVRSGESTEYETHEDYIPFFVRPPRRRADPSRQPKLLFLAPTNSYLAYANDSQVLVDRGAETGMGRLLVLQHADIHLHRHPELAASLYDKHADGSGACYSSRLRPVLNMRPRYHSWLGGHGSALYQYNGDTHILAWLEHQGVAFDVATDEDLHRDGLALLDGYAAVMTGTHPEYHSTAMWDAMRFYLERGGRLMYMGGNGWYWRVAFHASLPGVIEVRRAESGTRTWETDPGESYQSFDGELGGLWRRIGRPPNQLVGVGFVALGFDMSGHFRRRPGSYDPRAEFIFAGVGDEPIGDFGLVGGGAAGVELDDYNERLGSPPHALILATSENHTQLTLLTPEEFLVTPAAIGGDQSDKVRADMVFFEVAGGGAVFSTGSIAWAGSLSWNSYDNNVCRITANVLRRFLDKLPFTPPSGHAQDVTV